MFENPNCKYATIFHINMRRFRFQMLCLFPSPINKVSLCFLFDSVAVLGVFPSWCKAQTTHLLLATLLHDSPFCCKLVSFPPVFPYIVLLIARGSPMGVIFSARSLCIVSVNQIEGSYHGLPYSDHKCSGIYMCFAMLKFACV